MSPINPSPPPMTEVSIASINPGLHAIQSSRVHHSTRAPLPHPPRAHIPHHHSRTSSNDLHHFVASKGSISSDGTTSSSPSIYKSSPSHSPAQQYIYSPHLENGSMKDIVHSGHGHRTTLSGTTRQELSLRQHSIAEDNTAVFRYVPDAQDNEDDHAIWILLWLSFLDPLFSFFSAIFSLVVVIILILISPLRLCQSSCSIGTSTIRTIAPVFRNHLRLLYAPSVEDAHTFDFKPTALVLVNLISPVLAIGVAAAAWVSAAFWLFALMMGNPDGTERKDDGRAAVLTVRNWWEKFLLNAVR